MSAMDMLPPPPAHAPMVEPRADLSVRTVHTLSTYDLRQELNRRGEFERFFPGDDARCNYDTLLQAMTKLLMEDADSAAQARAAQQAAAAVDGGPGGAAGGAETLAEKLAREKAERKAAALERSRARQADRAYFAAKATANEAGERESEARRAAKIAACQIAPAATQPAAAPTADGPPETSATADAAESAPGAEVADAPQPEQAAASTETDELPAEHYRAY